MTIPILFAHDAGCRFARESDGGHSDAAKRLSDTYNLHKTFGEVRGVIAFSLSDGSSDDTVYPDRETAVAHQHHNETRRGYTSLSAPYMSVCNAAALIRFERHAAKIAPAQRGARDGGLVVIPRLTSDGLNRQINAMNGHGSLPVALGRKR